MIDHRLYRDNPSKWLGTCVEGPYIPARRLYSGVWVKLAWAAVIFSLIALASKGLTMIIT